LSVRYDGNVVGSFIGDAIRNLYGVIGSEGAYVFSSVLGVFNLAGIRHYAPAQGSFQGNNQVEFNAASIVPTDTNNHPASMSVLFVISY